MLPVVLGTDAIESSYHWRLVGIGIAWTHNWPLRECGDFITGVVESFATSNLVYEGRKRDAESSYRVFRS
jgi:hypothetical protein